MMDRRTFIATAPLAAISTQTGAASTDPHPAWLAEFIKADQNIIAGSLDPDDSKEDALWRERDKYCLLLAQTKATTTEGLAAQFAWFKRDLGYIIEDTAGDPYSGVMGLIETTLKEIVRHE